MNNFNEEELKVAIGALQCDLRGNWAYSYSDRLIELINLVNFLPSGDFGADMLSNIAHGQLNDPSDGRAFKGAYLYGYTSEEGRTQKVKEYLSGILTHPEYNNIEVSTMHDRDDKLNKLEI